MDNASGMGNSPCLGLKSSYSRDKEIIKWPSYKTDLVGAKGEFKGNLGWVYSYKSSMLLSLAKGCFSGGDISSSQNAFLANIFFSKLNPDFPLDCPEKLVKSWGWGYWYGAKLITSSRVLPVCLEKLFLILSVLEVIIHDIKCAGNNYTTLCM